MIAVNNAYGDPLKDEKGKATCYVPRQWTSAVWFGDSRWLDWHHKYLKGFSGIIAHCAPRHEKNQSLFYYKRGKQSGIDQRPSFVAWNKSSGGSAINFAYHLGASKIVLLGYDMHKVDGKTNWHDDHPSHNKDPYWRFLRPFPFIAKDAESLNLTIINATPGSAIDCFPIMTLENYLTSETGKEK